MAVTPNVGRFRRTNPSVAMVAYGLSAVLRGDGHEGLEPLLKAWAGNPCRKASHVAVDQRRVYNTLETRMWGETKVNQMAKCGAHIAYAIHPCAGRAERSL